MHKGFGWQGLNETQSDQVIAVLKNAREEVVLFQTTGKKIFGKGFLGQGERAYALKAKTRDRPGGSGGWIYAAKLA